MAGEQHDQQQWSLNGTSKTYLDENGEPRPVKANLAPFLAFLALSIVGLGLVVSQYHGSWLLQAVGAVLAIVGLVGMTPYKWRNSYWDLVVLLCGAVSIVIHMKLSISG